MVTTTKNAVKECVVACCYAADPCCGAVAAERWRLLQARRAAIDRHLLSARRSAANPPQAAAATDRWDRQTDGRTDGRATVSKTLLHILCGQCQKCKTAAIELI